MGEIKIASGALNILKSIIFDKRLEVIAFVKNITTAGTAQGQISVFLGGKI